MHTAVSLVKKEHKLFWKNRIGPFLTVAVLAIINFQAVHAIKANWTAWPDYIMVCNVTQELSILVFLAVQWIAFFQFWQLRKSGVDQVCFKGRASYQVIGLKMLPVVSTLAMLTFNLIVYDIIWVLHTTEADINVWRHFVLCWAMNYWVQGLLGIVMGAAIALSIKRIQTGIAALLVCILLFTPLLMPLLENFAYLHRKILKIADCFATYPAVSNWTANFSYGYGLERTRWAALALWFTASILAIYHTMSPGKKKIVRVKKGIMAVCCAALAVYTLMPTGMIYKDGTIYRNQFDGYIFQDSMYYKYDLPLQDIALYDDKQPNFTVEQINLDVNISRTMSTKATIQYSGAQGEVYFTLSHHYKIKKIVDQNGNKLPFDRQTDYFSFAANGSGSVTVYYSGSGTYYYSNDQAAFLPAYFAWYPMAGYHRLFTYTYGLTRVKDAPYCQYQVKVNAPYNIYTNLSKDGDNYTGYCDGPTVIAGIYKQVQGDHIDQVYSPMTNPNDTKTTGEIQNEVERLAQEYGVTLPANYHYTCMQVPECMYAVQSTFEDYQLYFYSDSTKMVAQRILLQLMLPKDSEYRQLVTQILDDGAYFYNYCANSPGETQYDQLCQAWFELYLSSPTNSQAGVDIRVCQLFDESFAYVIQGNTTGLIDHLSNYLANTEEV